MIYIPSTQEIKCPCCKKYYKLLTETYLPDGCENDGRIACLKCDATMGYTWDIPDIFLPEYKDPKYTSENSS